METNVCQILSVVRVSDNKAFSVGDYVTIGGINVGVIGGINQFTDDMRVHIDIDEESDDAQYYSIHELD